MPLKTYKDYTEEVGLSNYETKSPITSLVKHAKLYLFNQIKSPHGCHPAMPAFVDQFVNILVQFAPGGANTTVLREQYMRDIVCAFAATNRCLDYFQIIFRPEIADNPAASWNDPIYWREIPLYDALSAAAAVGNIRAFDHFFHNNPKVLIEAGALLNSLHSAASTGKSVMIEYLLVKMQHEIMDIKCHCRTPLDGLARL
jgi:hypothetical protein